MRAFLFALAMLVTLPAQAITYQFSGTCTGRGFMDSFGQYQTLPCENFDARIEISDPGYIPGDSIAEGEGPWRTGFHFHDGVYGSTTIEYGHEGYGYYWAYLPEVAGPGSLFMMFQAGHFTVGSDGAWFFTSEMAYPSWFEISGIDGRFALVPLPGTLALLAASLLYLTARTARSAKRARTASRALTR